MTDISQVTFQQRNNGGDMSNINDIQSPSTGTRTQIYDDGYKDGVADERERCVQAVESLKTCSCDSAGYVSEVVEYDNAKYDNAVEAIKAE